MMVWKRTCSVLMELFRCPIKVYNYLIETCKLCKCYLQLCFYHHLITLTLYPRCYVRLKFIKLFIWTVCVNYDDNRWKICLCAGKKYNIPVCLWLMDTHPYNPPLVYVKPTSNMQIKPGRHVDGTGRVYLPYLHEWRHVSSTVKLIVCFVILDFFILSLTEWCLDEHFSSLSCLGMDSAKWYASDYVGVTWHYSRRPTCRDSSRWWRVCLVRSHRCLPSNLVVRRPCRNRRIRQPVLNRPEHFLIHPPPEVCVYNCNH